MHLTGLPESKLRVDVLWLNLKGAQSKGIIQECVHEMLFMQAFLGNNHPTLFTKVRW